MPSQSDMNSRILLLLCLFLFSAFCFMQCIQLSIFIYTNGRHEFETQNILVAYSDSKGVIRKKRNRRRPRWWMSLQSVTPSWYDTVLLGSCNEVWIKNFRIPQFVIDNLCDTLKDELSPEDVTVREPISLKKRICIAVYKLASCAEYRAVASIFGVSSASVHRYVYRFCRAMCQRKANYIKWYTLQEAMNIASDIETRYKYPQAIGAIDGTHIPIRPPADGKADYICRKGYPSIVLQAIVDNSYKFRDTYANTPGAAHDATVFRRSPISNVLENRIPCFVKMINNNPVPLHILGDPAYPLSQLIIKGYIGRNITPEEESFNVYHSSARICVEIAFGKLKSRWRILQKKMDVETEMAPLIITTCCIMHNICEDLRIPVPTRTSDDNSYETRYPQPETEIYRRIDDNASLQIRDTIKDFLASSQPLRQSFFR